MALYGISGLNSTHEGLNSRVLSIKSSTLLVKPSATALISRPFYPCRRRCLKMNCKPSRSTVSEENGKVGSPSLIEDELGSVIKFKMSDFETSDCVRIGLGGRGDELVFEAVVNNCNSPCPQAQRRGKRAIEVFKKLAHRKL